MSTYHHENDPVLESLQRAVSQALERKRRLGQYAVVWRDGKPVRIEPPALAYRHDRQIERRPHVAEDGTVYGSPGKRKPDPAGGTSSS